MDAKYFKQCMGLVAAMVDPAEQRPALRGVTLEFTPGCINMVGTDGRRIAIVRAECAHMMGERVISVRPPEHLDELAGQVTVLEGMIMDESGAYVAIEALDVKPIDWRYAVTSPHHPESVAVDAALLSDTLARLAPFGWVSVRNGKVSGGPCILLTAQHHAQAVVMGVRTQ